MYLLVLAGDGIGPEITAATLSVLRAASERFDLQLRIEEAATGHAGLRTLGHTIHPDIVEKARRADGVVLGPTSTFEFKDPARGEVNPSMMLRKTLDLFANIRPARTYAGCAVASSISLSRVRTPKASMRIAIWKRAVARCW